MNFGNVDLSAVLKVGDRLKEPGSLRSLVLALFILKGGAVDDAVVDQVVSVILFIISALSFIMPEKKPVEIVVPAAVVPKAD